MMVLLTKIVSNVSLKALTILTKRLILDAWMGPDLPLQIETLQPLKFKDMYRWETSKDGTILINYFYSKFKP